MTDNYEMDPDEQDEIIEKMMKLKGNIVKSLDEVNSNIVALALEDNPAICEQARAEIIELMTSLREEQNAPSELDVLYLKSCLDKGEINPDSFTQPS